MGAMPGCVTTRASRSRPAASSAADGHPAAGPFPRGATAVIMLGILGSGQAEDMLTRVAIAAGYDVGPGRVATGAGEPVENPVTGVRGGGHPRRCRERRPDGVTTAPATGPTPSRTAGPGRHPPVRRHHPLRTAPGCRSQSRCPGRPCSSRCGSRQSSGTCRVVQMPSARQGMDASTSALLCGCPGAAKKSRV
jgi:hypothetical protein